MVLLYHSLEIYSTDSALFRLGHEAVVVFFVLSGLVISYVTETKETVLKDYAISRTARIFSVAIPAIIITFILDRIGYSINNNAYELERQAWDFPFIRMIISAVFFNEMWFYSIQLFSNIPYWSMNYEVWYYVIFAVAVFTKENTRRSLIALIVIFVGPKILLLMPIWWLGVYLNRSSMLRRTPELVGWLLFVVSFVGFWWYVKFDVSLSVKGSMETVIGVEYYKYMANSGRFLTDYLLAILVAANILGFRVIAHRVSYLFILFEKPIRYVASTTFTLYIIHQPLILFFNAMVYKEQQTEIGFAFVMIGTILSVFLIAAVTERKKHIWKREISRLLAYFERRIYRPLPSGG